MNQPLRRPSGYLTALLAVLVIGLLTGNLNGAQEAELAAEEPRAQADSPPEAADKVESEPRKKGRGKDGKEKRLKKKELPEQYQWWLELVDLLITKEETEAFLRIHKDYQRDAFIERFWKQRDGYLDTARNEFRDHWMELAGEAMRAPDRDQVRAELVWAAGILRFACLFGLQRVHAGPGRRIAAIPADDNV